ncbi:MAG: hypothetical protein ACSLEY_03205 [Candidatus Saccharimonadales bacterium]
MATVFLVVCFTYILVATPTVYAADAQWSGTDISYQQNTYSELGKATGQESHKLPKDTFIYQYVEAANTSGGGATQKAHLIYFPSGTDPPSATAATYVTFNYDGARFTNKSAEADITVTPQPAITSTGTSSCSVEGIGWIICPVTNFLARGMDFIYGIVSNFLEVRALTTTTDQAMYRAWDYVRNLANVLFVIGFLVVIYSQITGVGLSNYSIKKILPRVIVAAILVNTSYWICAVAIDVFNILGYSIQDMFISVRNSLVGDEGNSWDLISWESLTSVILSGGTILAGASIGTYLGISTLAVATAGVGITGALFVLLPLLISVLFIVLMTFLILAARQAIITILVVLAPVAFVAYLLPNTEEWFTKWRKTLFTLLLVFPAFSFVFGGAQLASAIIIQNATDINMVLLAMGVQVAPLAITPLLLRLGGGVLNRFAGIVNNPGKGIFDRSKNWAKDRSDTNRAKGLATLDRRAKTNQFRNGLPSSGNWRQRTRLNPNNMAYLREYKRRERAGMKSASEAMSEGLFTQTAAGQRIHSLNKDAGLEKNYGEARNQERWVNQVYGNPRTGTAGDPYRNNLHHESHMAEGRSKLLEEAATNHAERDLQTQINTTAGLRNLKIQSDVNAAHAQFQAANVTAEGKAEFKQQFQDGQFGSRALRLMNVQTSNFEKEAATIDSMLTKRAEADWERRSETDANIQNIRLKEVEASGSFARAEKEWQHIVNKVQAQGSAAPGVLNAVNVDVRAMTNAIQTDNRAIAVKEQAIESAKIVQKSEFAKALKTNATLRTEAASIDPHGANRVLAAAKKAVSEEMIRATNNIFDTMDYDVASNPDLLETAWNDAAARGELSEMIAYARKMAVNAPGLKKLKPLLATYTQSMGPLSDEVMTLKEVLAADDTFRNAGRDMEVWANNEINPDTGQLFRDFQEVRDSSSPYGNITASRFTRMNAYSQQETLYWLQQNSPVRLNQLLEGIGDETGQVWRELKGSIREDIKTIRAGNNIPNPN